MNETPKRLPPKSETIKLLLLRSGNKCAFPKCSRPIFNDENKLVGECCHIEAALPGGTRFNKNQSNEDRRDFKNLLFMCHQHHVETDELKKYTVKELKELKRAHESQTKEAVFQIKPNHLDQILEDFVSIKKGVDEITNSTKNLEGKTEKILEEIAKLKSNAKHQKSDDFDDILNESVDFLIPQVLNFYGRIDEISFLEDKLSSFNTIEIGGISGIGKSTLVAKIASKINTSVLWIDTNLATDLASMFKLIAYYLKDKEGDVSLYNTLKNPKTTTRNLIISALKAIDNKEVTLILDGVSKEINQFNDFIYECNRYFKKAKLIYTSTIKLPVWKFDNPCFRHEVLGLSIEEGIELFKAHGISESKPNTLVKLCSKVSGHPYMLKVISGLSQSISPEELLDEVSEFTNEKLFSYINDRLYKSLSIEEQEAIKSISILNTPFKSSVTKFFETKNAQKIFLSLRDKFLISKIHRKGNYFSIHDLVRDYALKDLKNDNRFFLNKKAFEYYNSLESPNYFETKELILHAIEANLEKQGKKLAEDFLSSLMISGEFYLAFDFAKVLEVNEKSKLWEIIYYVKGRILRFRENHQDAYLSYKKGSELASTSSSYKNVLSLELASVMNVLSDQNGKEYLLEESKRIYNNFISNGEEHDQVMALYSMGMIKLKSSTSENGLELIEKGIKIAESLADKRNLLASGYQLLGDYYYTNEQYDKAIKWLDKAFDEYWDIKEVVGMNAFEGIYHASNSLAWAYSKNNEIEESITIFEVCVGLAENFGMLSKLERSLFDLGYHLILDGRFERASDELTKHYQIITQNDEGWEIDMPQIFGTLMVAHWYSGDFENAIELCGLYIISSAQNKRPPTVSIAELSDLTEDFNFKKMFEKNIYLLAIPKGKKIVDLNNWIEKVISRRPDLEVPLKSFKIYKDGQEFIDET